MLGRVTFHIFTVRSHIYGRSYRHSQSESRLQKPRANKGGETWAVSGSRPASDKTMSDTASTTSTSGQNPSDVPIDIEFLSEHEFGEHAAAFLRGNYTPVIAERTANYALKPKKEKKDCSFLARSQ